MESRAHGETQHGSNLNDFAQLAAWVTPTTRDGKDSQDQATVRKDGTSKLSDSVARQAAWATPVATEIGNTLENYLAMKANMTSGKRTAITHPSVQAQLALPGPLATGSTAETGKRAQLNPAHSRWLMGYPKEWDDCAGMAMQLSLL
jgi:hypothetical protein